MLPAGKSDLAKAYNQHLGIVTATKSKTISHYLLLFYAVECGVKSIYLDRNHYKTTDDLPASPVDLRGSHKLDDFVKALRIPAADVSPLPPSFRLQRDKGKGDPHHISFAHQSWRYGINIEPKDEEQLKEWLNKLQEWIQKEI